MAARRAGETIIKAARVLRQPPMVGHLVGQGTQTHLHQAESLLPRCTDSAMAMYRDACKGAYDQVVLCSDDSDAGPVLEALREDLPQLVIGIVSPVRPPADPSSPRRHASSLANHAHWVRRYLLDDELSHAQLPAIVPTPRKPLPKPPHW